MILRARSVAKSFEQAGSRIDVLKNLELDVHSGETIAIVGKSGTGKSTLLSLLAGLDAPTSGKIELAGKDIGSMSEEELTLHRARHVGIVFQQFHLMSSFTALENASLPLELRADPDATEKARAALAQVGLSHRETHFPQQLSGGEKQRVAIARALAAEPSLLLADEPSGSLDTDTGQQVMRLFFDLVKKRGMTLLLVTHSDEWVGHCGRALTLRSGRLE